MSKYSCTDGGCVFVHPGGMHTNGGCHCLEMSRPQLRKRIHNLALEHKQMLNLLRGFKDKYLGGNELDRLDYFDQVEALIVNMDTK